MHVAKSEMRMKYKEGGLTGGAVALDELFRVIILSCLILRLLSYRHFLFLFFFSLACLLLICNHILFVYIPLCNAMTPHCHAWIAVRKYTHVCT